MEHQNYTHHADGEALSCTSVAPTGEARPGQVVIMHGAGTGSKERMIPLAESFAAAGHGVVTFDFSGHGTSSGQLSALSLERRFLQAQSVIETLAPAGQLILVGFSMSGQTVADLLTHLSERVTTIVLAAPAAYAPEAWKLPFGPGSGFSELIRTPRSWMTSSAFGTYASFAGRSVLVKPEHDEVIPPGVTARIEAALRKKSRLTTIIPPGSPHTLGQWLAEHPNDREQIVAAALDTP
ncbi:alpha/beta hydrolase [Kitasatospora sp. NPDC056138]|uniref:alpha/beta hydrolase n=1 Tax=Kitasatospora sp. NPDC056138 TaxID=3345724 RepID=UPI0035DB280C